MGYGKPTAEVVGGSIAAFAGYLLLSEPATEAELLIATLLLGLVVLGLSLAIHGLFSGIESAVANGTERRDTPASTE